MEKTKVLLIAPQFLPIPAVKGGAVETLITNLIKENEIYGSVFFYVISTYNAEAIKYNWKNSKIFYIKHDSRPPLRFIFYFLFRKILFNRFTKKMFKKNRFRFEQLTPFGYECTQIAKKIKPDIIISEGYDKLNRLWPLVSHFKNINFYYHPHYVREEVLSIRKLFPNTIAISKFVLDHWVKDKTLNGNNVVVFNGIDISLFNKKINSEQRNKIRKSLSLNEDDFVVLFTGRLRPHKGLLELLKAFITIDNNKIKLLIVGDFLSETNRNDKLTELEFEHECYSIINFDNRITRVGRIAYNDIPNYYHISDVQCIPSTCEEGAGLVAVEGMASGLPLIITNSGGLPEYAGTDCAIILNVDDDLEDNIAKSIIKLYNNKSLRNKMSEIGLARSKKFSSEKYYKDYVDVILNKSSD